MLLYSHAHPARFLARPNRFIAEVELDGRRERVHVKNTGRLGELLLPGAAVWLAEGENPARKTRYDLVAAKKDGRLVNIDSQAPNRAAAELLRRLMPGAELQAEVTLGESRLDFCAVDARGKTYIEVKGCTLERGGVALFPDAPTERGVKHLRELENAVRAGHRAALLMIIQMKGVRRFAPNRQTHPAFADALRRAAQAGVRLLAYDCLVTPDSLTADMEIPIDLEEEA